MRGVPLHGHAVSTKQNGAPLRRSRTLIYRNLRCRNQATIAHVNERNKEHSMMDVLMLGLAFSFFALAIGYAYVCERL